MGPEGGVKRMYFHILCKVSVITLWKGKGEGGFYKSPFTHEYMIMSIEYDKKSHKKDKIDIF